jgi:hypothetical protein
MNTADRQTVAIKPCCSCGAGLLEGSRFCRLCGANQQAIDAIITNSESELRSSYITSKLSSSIPYHPVSGPLVQAVARGVPASASQSVARDLPKRLLFALMAIPIWVMIILLSPIDAYASAKIIGQRV